MDLNCVLILLFATISANSKINNDVDRLVKIMEEGIARSYKIPRTSNSYEFIPTSANYIDYGTFDHIIVGAGSAGGVIANRLTEDRFRQVLLLEAGGEQTEFSDIPSMAVYLYGLEENWNYFTIPQNTSCLGLVNKQCAVPRGKALGGTSTINALIYAKGNKRDYDNWAKEGNLGWSYKEVLPIFKKFENFNGPSSPYRGKGGYLNIDTFEPINLQGKAFLEAIKELGLKELDYNGENQIGCGKIQLNTLKGERHSVANAYLKPILKERSNLRVLTRSFVIKILINDEKRAYGVLFSRNGKMYVAKSRRDIVISAGTIDSPQLLMLSGIGPKRHLKEMGIPVLQNLHVGENLEDHPIFPYLELLTNFTETEYSLKALAEGYIRNDGSLSNPFNTQGVAFVQTNRTKIPGYPDIELLMVPSISGGWETDKMWNINEETSKVITHDDRLRTITIGVIVLHPKSKGYIRLQSANPFEYPLIHLNMLSDDKDEDIETMYQGVQFVQKLIATVPFRRLQTKMKDFTLPACRDLKYLSKEYWYCQLRHLTASVFHPIGSCKMGVHPSLGAVVNPELKVFGVKNLRVADASVIPSSISGHTNAPTIMIGEKAAELIRGRV